LSVSRPVTCLCVGRCCVGHEQPMLYGRVCDVRYPPHRALPMAGGMGGVGGGCRKFYNMKHDAGLASSLQPHSASHAPTPHSRATCHLPIKVALGISAHVQISQAWMEGHPDPATRRPRGGPFARDDHPSALLPASVFMSGLKPHAGVGGGLPTQAGLGGLAPSQTGIGAG
jgi:hypothetical protein